MVLSPSWIDVLASDDLAIDVLALELVSDANTLIMRQGMRAM